MLTGKEKSNSHGARPVHSSHLDHEVDSDQYIVNQELSLPTLVASCSKVSSEEACTSSGETLNDLRLRCGVSGVGLRVYDKFRVQGLGCIQGSGLRVHDAEC